MWPLLRWQSFSIFGQSDLIKWADDNFYISAKESQTNSENLDSFVKYSTGSLVGAAGSCALGLMICCFIRWSDFYFPFFFILQTEPVAC